MRVATINNLILGLLIVIAVPIALSGCANSRVRESSSMSLDKVIASTPDSRVALDKSPLRFPVSVAIMVVPGGSQPPETALHQAAERLKKQLLENKKYVSSASIVSTREVSKKVTLEQVGASYGADVAILIFYQQDQRSVQSSLAGMLDVAIVPVFVVPGVKVKTATLIEGMVAHIPSNAVIFRKSAFDDRTSSSTTFSEDNTAAKASVESFNAAMMDFGKSLADTIHQFDSLDLSKKPSMAALLESSRGSGSEGSGESRAANDYWKKVNTAKSGGGAFGYGILVVFGVACLIARKQRR